MGMEVTVEHLGNVQFEIKARGHSIICDQPAESHGDDEGMTPPELMLASLASCAGFYAAEYLKRMKIAEGGTHVRVTADKVLGPARLDNFQIEVEVPVELCDEHRAGLERAVHRCLIHNTLMQPPTIGLAIKTAVAAV
jgi:putative redox protein